MVGLVIFPFSSTLCYKYRYSKEDFNTKRKPLCSRGAKTRTYCEIDFAW